MNIQTQVQDYPGTGTGLFRNRHRTILGHVQDYSGTGTGLSWDRYRTIQGQVQDCPRIGTEILHAQIQNYTGTGT